jgi:hypothetical protein
LRQARRGAILATLAAREERRHGEGGRPYTPRGRNYVCEDVQLEDAEAVAQQWEVLKAREGDKRSPPRRSAQ